MMAVCVCVQVEEVIERLVSALSDKDTGTVTYPLSATDLST